jgi:hypothetical protein
MYGIGQFGQIAKRHEPKKEIIMHSHVIAPSVFLHLNNR